MDLLMGLYVVHWYFVNFVLRDNYLSCCGCLDFMAYNFLQLVDVFRI